VRARSPAFLTHSLNTIRMDGNRHDTVHPVFRLLFDKG
jgi:hypothetical protein